MFFVGALGAQATSLAVSEMIVELSNVDRAIAEILA